MNAKNTNGTTGAAEQAEVDGAVAAHEASDVSAEAELPGAAEQAEVGEVEDEHAAEAAAAEDPGDVGDRHDQSPTEADAHVAEPENMADPE